MSQKTLVTIGIIVGSTIGSFIPALFGVSLFSLDPNALFISVVTSGIGAILGIWIGYKMGA